MDEETVRHLWALREVNIALLAGLEAAVFAMGNWDRLEEERRRSMIRELQGLIEQGRTVYEMGSREG